MVQKITLILCFSFFHSTILSMYLAPGNHPRRALILPAKKTQSTITLFNDTYSVDITNPNASNSQIELTRLTQNDPHNPYIGKPHAHPIVDTSLFIVTYGGDIGQMNIFARRADSTTYEHIGTNSLSFSPKGVHCMQDNHCLIYNPGDRNNKNFLLVKFSANDNKYSMSTITNQNANFRYLGHCPNGNYFICKEKDRYDTHLCTIAHDGTVLKKLLNFDAQKVAFSADGQHYIAMSHPNRNQLEEKQTEIYLASINLKEKQVETIKRQYLELQYTDIALSPDGKLFFTYRGGFFDIHDNKAEQIYSIFTNYPCVFGQTIRAFGHDIYTLIENNTTRHLVCLKDMPKDRKKLLQLLKNPSSRVMLLLLKVIKHIESK